MQKVLEAISDPSRRKILDLLKKKSMSVGELHKHFDMTGASLSHHLNKLKSADLVLTERQGQTILYSLHTTVFEDAAKLVISFFQNKERRKK
jgi:DNA-binding transcriptional ArsR family regulator